MKKYWLPILLLVVVLCCLQWGRAPMLNTSLIQKHTDGYSLKLTVTANKLVILNQKSLAQKLITRVRQNNFSNFSFSYDILGNPSGAEITVYANQFSYALDMPAFCMKYSFENPEESLVILK